MDKWLKMLKKWSKYRNSDKVRRKRKSMCLGGWGVHPSDESGFEKLIQKSEMTGRIRQYFPVSL